MEYLIGLNKYKLLILFLLLFTIKIGKSQIYIKVKQIKKLSTKTINSIVIDNNNEKWLGTDNGLYKITNNDSIVKYTENNSGLQSNQIYKLTFDEKFNLWIGTPNGLNAYNRKSQQFITYYANLNNKHSLP